MPFDTTLTEQPHIKPAAWLLSMLVTNNATIVQATSAHMDLASTHCALIAFTSTAGSS